MYRWTWREIGWAAFVAAGTAVLMALVEFDANAIGDWRSWAVALGSGAIRAAAGGVLAVLTRART